jgi:chemotaxis protein methyltransferase CheR
VRGQVCKRIARRLREAGVSDLDAYRRRLEADPEEWHRLDSFCRITISRFCRDRPVFDWLARVGFPGLADAALAMGRNKLICWSAGCGGGEEPYTLRILWDLCLAGRFPGLELDIVATDADPVMLDRARRATYSAGCLREVPHPWIGRAFADGVGEFRLRQDFRHDIQFIRQDIRQEMPVGPFDLVLCRNLAFTYFDKAVQRNLLSRISRRMVNGGILIIGRNETLPGGVSGFEIEKGASAVCRFMNGHLHKQERAVDQRTT